MAQAIEEARRRAEQSQAIATLHCASVTDLDFLQPPYDLAIDIGCAHALDEGQLRRYHVLMSRLLKPGAFYLLFARLSDGMEL